MVLVALCHGIGDDNADSRRFILAAYVSQTSLEMRQKRDRCCGERFIGPMAGRRGALPSRASIARSLRPCLLEDLSQHAIDAPDAPVPRHGSFAICPGARNCAAVSSLWRCGGWPYHRV